MVTILDTSTEFSIIILINSMDPRYKFSIYSTFLVSIDEYEEIGNNDVTDASIVLEEFFNYRELEKIAILKKLWADNIFDSDFDLQDMREICVRYRAPPPEEFLSMNEKIETGVEQVGNGHSQLVFIF